MCRNADLFLLCSKRPEEPIGLKEAESAAGMLGPKVGNLSYGEMRERSMNGTAAVIFYERRADTVQMSALLIH